MSKELDSAVKAFQLYLGSSGIRMKDQQKLYSRAMRAAEKIAKKRKMDLTDVFEQLTAQAKTRGAIIPLPGHHY